MYVCVCKGITDREVRQAIRLGASTLEDLRNSLGVASQCGQCAGCARDLLAEESTTLALAECRRAPEMA